MTQDSTDHREGVFLRNKKRNYLIRKLYNLEQTLVYKGLMISHERHISARKIYEK